MTEVVMHVRAEAALLAVLAVGCASRNGEELTQQQTNQIVSEVKTVGDSVMAHFVRLDGPGALAFYANTPHWVMFNADGSQWTYEMTRRGLTSDTISTAKSYKYTTVSQNFWVVNRDLVIAAWVIKDVAVMKSGDTLSVDPHPYTVVLQKIGGQWKIVWSQDSGTPVIKKATAHRH
jgi:hypothetical protein